MLYLVKILSNPYQTACIKKTCPFRASYSPPKGHFHNSLFYLHIFPIHALIFFVIIHYAFLKGGNLTLYQRILKESKRLDSQISAIRQELSSLPEGKLICSINGTHFKWYHSDGHTKTYIPKENSSLAIQLARKKYLNFKLKDIENEKNALDYYLKHHRPISQADELLSTHSEYQKLLSSQFTPLSTELSLWMNSPYERNPVHPERLIYKSISGNTVRSKSEMIIDMLLYQYQIPFRYECVLRLENTVLYPDFTIRHPLTGECYYWEHFGMMDQQAYASNCISKLKIYTEHNILPGIHLITTYETLEHPLNMDMVLKIIEYYFL